MNTTDSINTASVSDFVEHMFADIGKYSRSLAPVTKENLETLYTGLQTDILVLSELLTLAKGRATDIEDELIARGEGDICGMALGTEIRTAFNGAEFQAMCPADFENLMTYIRENPKVLSKLIGTRTALTKALGYDIPDLMASRVFENTIQHDRSGRNKVKLGENKAYSESLQKKKVTVLGTMGFSMGPKN